MREKNMVFGKGNSDGGKHKHANLLILYELFGTARDHTDSAY